jgi:hypothetical protein
MRHFKRRIHKIQGRKQNPQGEQRNGTRLAGTT